MQEAFREALSKAELDPNSRRKIESSLDVDTNIQRLKYNAQKLGRRYSSWVGAGGSNKKELEDLATQWKEIYEYSLETDEIKRADIIHGLTQGLGIDTDDTVVDPKKRGFLLGQVQSQNIRYSLLLSNVPGLHVFDSATFVLYGFVDLSGYSENEILMLSKFIAYIKENNPDDLKVSLELVLSSWMSYKKAHETETQD